MTEMTTNMTDHSTSTRSASAAPSTWLAIEKNANVSRPVAAIPMERMRAPLPYERGPPDPPGARPPCVRPPCVRPPCAACSAVVWVDPAARSAHTLGVSSRAGPGLEPDKQHRPRERRAHLGNLAVAPQQLHERPPGPVVQMPGCVAELRPVRAAGHVQHPPQRLARDRHEQVALSAARHLAQRVLGGGGGQIG